MTVTVIPPALECERVRSSQTARALMGPHAAGTATYPAFEQRNIEQKVPRRHKQPLGVYQFVLQFY